MTITSSQYILVMWSLALYVVESFPAVLKSQETSSSSSFASSSFVSRILSIAVSHVSGSEEMTPWPIFRQLSKGLERLLLLPEAASCLGPEIRQTLTSVAVEKSNASASSPRRTLAAVALLLSTMYTNTSLPVFPSSFGDDGDDDDDDAASSKFFVDVDAAPTVPTMDGFATPDAASTSTIPSGDSDDAGSVPTPLNPAVPTHMQSSDPEALVAAMEKVAVLFDNLRRSSAAEAEALARLLPNVLLDFFQPQDVMNKLIGEFLSNQQPHPQLLARCLFRLFGRLIADGRGSCVTDWVAISLGNVVARTPIAMATWSLTCCFVAAADDVWLRRTFPLLVNRVGLLEEVDERLFRLAAKHFFRRIKDVGDKEAFKAAFARHRTTVEHYDRLLRELGDGE